MGKNNVVVLMDTRSKPKKIRASSLGFKTILERMFARRILLSFVIFSLSKILIAGGNNEIHGARSVAMGGAAVSTIDIWSTSNNPGALGLLDQFGIGVSYESRHLLPEAGLKSFALAAPVSGGTFSLVGHSYGYASFSDNRLGVAYARKLAKYLSVGVQLNYVNTQIGDVYGSRSTMVAELGALMKPNDKISLGVHLYNPTRQKLADFDNERIPTILSVGGDYKFSEKVSMALQVDKDLDLPINLRSGIEYAPVEQIFIRAGYATLNSSLGFGIGFIWNNVGIDIATNWNQQLGSSASASLSYYFGKRKA